MFSNKRNASRIEFLYQHNEEIYLQSCRMMILIIAAKSISALTAYLIPLSPQQLPVAKPCIIYNN